MTYKPKEERTDRKLIESSFEVLTQAGPGSWTLAAGHPAAMPDGESAQTVSYGGRVYPSAAQYRKWISDPAYEVKKHKGLLVMNPYTRHQGWCDKDISIEQTSFGRGVFQDNHPQLGFIEAACDYERVYTYPRMPIVSIDGTESYAVTPGCYGGAQNPQINGDVQHMINMTLQNCYNKAAGEDLNLLVTAAEWHKTRHLFEVRIKRLIHMLRRVRSLGLRRLKKLSKPAASELTDAWMEVRYGLRPLVYDLMSLRKILLNGLKPRWRFSSHETRRIEVNELPHLWDDMFAGASQWMPLSSAHVKGKTFYEIRVNSVMFVEPDRLNDSISQVMRSFDAIAAAWDLIPYSFIIDWFIPFGELLSASTAQMTVNVAATSSAVTVTCHTEIEPRVGSIVNGDPDLTLNGVGAVYHDKITGGVPGSIRAVLYERIANTHGQFEYPALKPDVKLSLPKVTDLIVVARNLAKR